MSLIINVTTPVGIVMAADSRQSYRNQKGMARIGSDNVTKLFMINKRVAAGIAGLAFLDDNGTQRNVGDFLLEMSHADDVETLSVMDISKRINDKYNSKWRDQLALAKLNLEKEVKQKGIKVLSEIYENNRWIINLDNNGKQETAIVGVEPINFIIAGYNIDGSYETNIVYIPGDVQKKRDSKIKGMESGATWIGQTDVVTRIVLGYDPRIQNIKYVSDAIKTIGIDQYIQSMHNLEYVINWGTMTLQDAVDLSSLLIKTTSAIQRFSDGIAAEPGDMPGVGGNIDILVIQKNEGISWISKKELKVRE